MGAVDIGVGHDDDLLVSQARAVIVPPGAAAQGLGDVRDLLVAGQLVRRGAGHVQDLAAQRQHGLGLARPGRLGGAAGAVALDQEDLGAVGAGAAAIGQLARQPNSACCRLARQVLGLPSAQPFFRPFQRAVEQGVGGGGVGRQPMVHVILHRRLDQVAGLRIGQTLLGLALKLRIGNEHGQEGGGIGEQIVGGDAGRALVAGKLGEALEAAQEAGAQP